MRLLSINNIFRLFSIFCHIYRFFSIEYFGRTVNDADGRTLARELTSPSLSFPGAQLPLGFFEKIHPGFQEFQLMFGKPGDELVQGL